MGMMPRTKWTAAQVAGYEAWRKPLEDSYADVLPALASKYDAKITDTGVVIIVEILVGQYTIPGYGVNDVTVSVCSPAGNMQIGDYDGWTVHVFDYAIAGAQVTALRKKGADTAWILDAVDTAVRRGGRYVQSRSKSKRSTAAWHKNVITA